MLHFGEEDIKMLDLLGFPSSDELLPGLLDMYLYRQIVSQPTLHLPTLDFANRAWDYGGDRY